MIPNCVSIVVPIYKVEKYINRCIESLLRQTYNNLEIILVDDGSPDNCPQICDYYKEKDSRIKVIHKANGGLSDARNAGIKEATGQYITFVDSDDYVHKDFIRLMVNNLSSNCKAMVVVNYQNVYENQPIEDAKIDKISPITLTKNEACLRNFAETTFRTAWGKLYTIDMIHENLFPKGKIHEDEFTTFMLLYKADSISYVKQNLYYYLQRSDGIMGGIRDIPSKVNYDAIEACELRCVFYLKNGEKELFEKAAWNMISTGLLLFQNYKQTPFARDIKKRIGKDLYFLKSERKTSFWNLLVWSLYLNFSCSFKLRQHIRKMYKSLMKRRW